MVVSLEIGTPPSENSMCQSCGTWSAPAYESPRVDVATGVLGATDLKEELLREADGICDGVAILVPSSFLASTLPVEATS